MAQCLWKEEEETEIFLNITVTALLDRTAEKCSCMSRPQSRKEGKVHSEAYNTMELMEKQSDLMEKRNICKSDDSLMTGLICTGACFNVSAPEGLSRTSFTANYWSGMHTATFKILDCSRVCMQIMFKTVLSHC